MVELGGFSEPGLMRSTMLLLQSYDRRTGPQQKVSPEEGKKLLAMVRSTHPKFSQVEGIQLPSGGVITANGSEHSQLLHIRQLLQEGKILRFHPRKNTWTL